MPLTDYCQGAGKLYLILKNRVGIAERTGIMSIERSFTA